MHAAFNLPRRATRRGVSPIACLLTALVLLAGASAGPAAAQDERTVEFHGDDTVWTLEETTWTAFEGRWLVGARIAMTKAPAGTVQINPLQLFSVFCSGLLDSKPGAPADIANADIHRIDLSLADTQGNLMFGQAVPVTLQNGRCAIAPSGQQNFLITYPGRLSGWILAGTGVQQIEGAGNRRQHNFKPVPGTKADWENFDPAVACEAILTDPTAQALLGRMDEQIAKAGVEVEPGKAVIMAIAEDASGDGSGVWAGTVYDVSGGTCVQQESFTNR